MNGELIEAIRAIVKTETGLLRHEVMDQFTLLHGQVEQMHIRVDNLHNEMYDLRCEWRRWHEQLQTPNLQAVNLSGGTGGSDRDAEDGANDRQRRMPALTERFATQEDLRYIAAKLGVHDFEIDRLKQIT